MTLAKILSYLQGATSKDLFEVAKDLGRFLTNAAAKAEIKAWIVFLAAFVAVFAVGLLGYKMVKPLAAIFCGGIGYFVGTEIYHALIKVRFEGCPQAVAYVLGGVIAAGFLVLGFFKFSYVLFALGAFSGYFTVMFYMENGTVLAIGAALLAGMLMITLIRTAVIIVSSLGCAVLSVSFLSGLFPKVEAFQSKPDSWAFIALTAILFFIYVSFQFATNRRRKEYIE